MVPKSQFNSGKQEFFDAMDQEQLTEIVQQHRKAESPEVDKRPDSEHLDIITTSTSDRAHSSGETLAVNILSLTDNEKFAMLDFDKSEDHVVHNKTRSVSETQTSRVDSRSHELRSSPILVANDESRTLSTPQLSEIDAEKCSNASMFSMSSTPDEEEKSIKMQNAASVSHAQGAAACEKCEVHQIQLQQLKAENAELQRETKALQKSVERYQFDLSREKTFRDEMEATLTQAVEESQFRANNLYNLVREMEAAALNSSHENRRLATLITAHLEPSVSEKQELQHMIGSLQNENEQLMGLHSARAQEMDDEDINLPENVDELHLQLLKLRDDLIKSKVAKEHTETSLKFQLNTCLQRLEAAEKTHASQQRHHKHDIRLVRDRCSTLEVEKSHLGKQLEFYAALEEQLKSSKQELVAERAKSAYLVNEHAEQTETWKHHKEKLEKQAAEQTARIRTLHDSLENSEHVQMDFVRMNQELQMALERIRQEETEVRWQFEEDVQQCHQCHEPFNIVVSAQQRRSGAVGFLSNVAAGSSSSTTTRQRSPKLHCRHCGKIFCDTCLREMHAGPNKRLVKVCDLCHTLLSKNHKPYFSERIDRQAANVSKSSVAAHDNSVNAASTIPSASSMPSMKVVISDRAAAETNEIASGSGT